MRGVKVTGIVMIALLVSALFLGQAASAAKPNAPSMPEAKEFTLSGEVSTNSGTAIANATVRVHKSLIATSIGGKARDPVNVTVVTDQQGKYSIKDLPPGSYTMTVSRDGYANNTRALTITNANQVQNFTLEPQRYKVSGTVSSGAIKLEQAKVEIAGKTAFTDTQGNYQVAGIMPGPYPMTVSKTGYITMTRNIVIANESQNQNFALAVAPTFTVSAIVKGYDSRGSLVPVRNATVTIAEKTGTTNNYGTFSIGGIFSGTYTLEIRHPDYATYRTTVVIADRNWGADIYMTTAGYTVSGKVTNSQGPVVNARVTVGTQSEGRTDTQGNYRVAWIRSGTYNVTAWIGNVGEVKSVTITDQDVVVNFSSASTPAPVTNYTVSGKVADRSGAGVAGATVRIAGQSLTTDAEGKYSASVPPGDYPMTASKAGYSGPTEREAKNRVVVTTSDKVQNFLLSPAIYSVSGIVTNRSGARIEGAIVRTMGKQATTNSRGEYSISELPAGTHMITVSKGGYSGITGNVTIDNANTIKNFVLTN